MRNVRAVVCGGVVAPSCVGHQSTPDGQIRRDSGYRALQAPGSQSILPGALAWPSRYLLLLRNGNELHESDPRCPHRF